MSQVFSVDGFKALRVSWAILGASIAIGAGIIAGSHWYAQKEQHDRDLQQGFGVDDSRPVTEP